MKKVLLIFIFLSSCSSLDVDKRANIIGELNNNNFKEFIFKTRNFDIYSLSKTRDNSSLTVYIEGDGLSWVDRFTISSNPTPIDPLAFKLALIDSSKNIIYLARPCQYTWVKSCKKDIWTVSQYSGAVLSSYKEVIDRLSNKYDEIHLVGYSGGAGIAMYLGSIENKNIKSIRTIAGNINHNALTQMLKISRLKKSVNFFSIEKKLKLIPQTHYYGSKDRVVPNQLQISYKKRNKNNKCINIKNAKEASHSEGWEMLWKSEHKKLPLCK